MFCLSDSDLFETFRLLPNLCNVNATCTRFHNVVSYLRDRQLVKSMSEKWLHADQQLRKNNQLRQIDKSLLKDIHFGQFNEKHGLYLSSSIGKMYLMTHHGSIFEFIVDSLIDKEVMMNWYNCDTIRIHSSTDEG